MQALAEVLSQLQAWHWLSLGILFIVIDTLITGGFLLGAAIAAGVIWLLKLTLPELSWQLQLLLFSLLTLVFSALYKRYFKGFNQHTDAPLINNRAAQMVGREFKLKTPLPEGNSKLQIGDTFWRVNCTQDIASKTRVRIVSTEHNVLFIEACAAKSGN